MIRMNSFEKLLAGFVFFITVMIGARIFFSGEMLFIFLLWNIFLAWIPMFISSCLVKRKYTRWKQVLLCSMWLLFFPNALYIITDLVHLQHNTSVPKWFDAVLLFSCSAVGLLMAFVSLYRVEIFLTTVLTKRVLRFTTIFLLFLGSFGVYLGRFLRWNSWDIISNPLNLFSTIAERLVFPFDHLRTWATTGILTILFYLLYQAIKKLSGYMNQATYIDRNKI